MLSWKPRDGGPGCRSAEIWDKPIFSEIFESQNAEVQSTQHVRDCQTSSELLGSSWPGPLNFHWNEYLRVPCHAARESHLWNSQRRGLAGRSDVITWNPLGLFGVYTIISGYMKWINSISIWIYKTYSDQFKGHWVYMGKHHILASPHTCIR